MTNYSKNYANSLIYKNKVSMIIDTFKAEDKSSAFYLPARPFLRYNIEFFIKICYNHHRDLVKIGREE